MAKKKRTVSKPTKSTTIVKTEAGDAIEEGPTELLASPKPVSWVEKVEKEDFSAQAKDVWSKFKSNQVCTPSTRLEFTKPMKIGDQFVFKLDLDEVECEASFWKNSIVCIVLGVYPLFKVFEGFIQRVWGNLGIERIARINSGFTLISFRDEETRNLIMETGVIHFDKKHVVLRPWTMDVDSVRMVKSIPIWVRLNGLGLQYWGKNNLSALVSTIGKPIMADKVTQSRTMIKYARVLVDMENSNHPPKTIAYINEMKQLVKQRNCNEEKGAVWKKKGNAEQRSKATVAEKTDTVKVGSEIGGESVGEGGCQAEKTHGKGENKQQISDDTSSKEVWLTPRKRGSKQVAMNDEKATTSNGYEVLSEQVVEDLVTSTTVNPWNKRIILIWQAKFVHVEVLLDNEQFIHCKVKIVGLIEEFYFTAVYGSSCPAERKLLFEMLAALGMLNRPLLILGDFNAIFNFQDRNGGKQIMTKDVEDAQNWLSLGQVEKFVAPGPSTLGLTSMIWEPESSPNWTMSLLMKIVGDLEKKLLRVKHVLKKFNRNEVGDVVNLDNRCKADFITAQENLASDPNNSHFLQEENRLGQENFMGKKSSATRRLDQDCLQQRPTLNLEQQAKLIRPFNEKDVKKAMFGIHSTKSPGLDGFGLGFFKSLWKEIRADVSKAILNFFEEGSMPISLKDAIITLIPKTQDPKDASNYRLIACCNTVYKCISKMICSRLAEVLYCLVSDNQGALLKTDSLLITS
uniref:DUF4283 domain-containing protein n=1 Tax=Cannabis sativa TaxID=3483 RepID=A0A803NSM9_CANSA